MLAEKSELFNAMLLQVREAVWNMETPDDLREVLVTIEHAFNMLEYPFYACSINIVEQEQEKTAISFWALTHTGEWIQEKTKTTQNHPVLRFMKASDPIERPNLEEADPYNERVSIQDGYGVPIRCVVDVPYAFGTLSLCSLIPHAFTDEHIHFVQQLLPYFEDALRRLKDLQLLKFQNDKLVWVNKELETFTSVASHDLKAPLRRIVQLLTNLSKTHDAQDDAERAASIRLVLDQADGMTELVEDLLEYTKMGHQEVSNTPVSLAQAVAKAIDNLAVSIQESNARISVAELPMVLGDATSLVQLFQNLIENGIKYQRDGVPCVDITGTCLESEVRVAVKDNGIGIDPDYAARIFEPFKRLHADHEFKGTGIGLATCLRIMERQQGKIWVESEPGQGAIFYCSFMLAPVDLSSTLDSPAPTASPLSDKRSTTSFHILLADDSLSNQMFASALLKRMGHTVQVVTTGEEALVEFEKGVGLFDVLIVDIQMPIIDGNEVVSHIRRKEKQTGGRIPIIALTSHTIDEKDAYLAKGFSGFLSKPVEADALRDELFRVCP